MQTKFKGISGHGGVREGAGRPKKKGSCSHKARAKVDMRKPLHLTAGVRKGVVFLRSPKIGREFRNAIKRLQKFGLNVNHYTIQGNHFHMIVEAKDNQALSRGMNSLGSRLGKFLRRLSLGKGAIFKERFHLHVLKTPTEVRRALEYVLLNLSKHRKLLAEFDVFSSGYYFKEWKALIGDRDEPLLEEELECIRPRDADFLVPFHSWLGREGWKRGFA